MKIFFKFFILGILFLVMQNSLSAQVNVPDANFRAVLSSDYGITFDGNNNINNLDKTKTIDYLDVFGKNINNLKGIEAFSKLEELFCSQNNLTSLDVSSNTSLRRLFCNNNQLTGINIEGNINLIELDCSNNLLTDLNISTNNLLSRLSCSHNKITILNLSQIPDLYSLNCEVNLLSNLNLSTNINLNYLTCTSNQLTSLDISNNNYLYALDCCSNQLKSLDISLNNNLSYLNISGNTNPFSLSVWIIPFPPEGLEFIDTYPKSKKILSANINFPDPKFRSVLHSKYGINFDSGGSITNPEKAADITSLNVHASGINDLSGIIVFTSLIELNCSANNLTECNSSYNTDLQYLDCSSNNIKSLNVSAFNSLTNLNCSSNQISEIDLSANTSLLSINISSNKTPFTLGTWGEPFPPSGVNFIDTTPASKKENGLFATIVPDSLFRKRLTEEYQIKFNGKNIITNVSVASNLKLIDVDSREIENLTGLKAFYELIELRCNNNKLTQLDLSGNKKLIYLQCNNNQITSIDLSKNENLRYVQCDNNKIGSLNLSYNKNLLHLQCSNNLLTSLTTNPGLGSLFCSQNKISKLDVSFSPKYLTTISCADNPINNLDLTGNISLNNLDVGFTNIDSLDVSKNIYLQRLICNGNQIRNLSLVNNNYLTYLECQNNQLTSLNFSNNTAIRYLFCYSNKLTSLDLSKIKTLYELYCNDNQITNLEVQLNTFLDKIYCNSNQLQSLDISENLYVWQLNISSNLTPFALNVWKLPFDITYFVDTNPASTKILGTVSVNEATSNLETFSLSQNYPNPFNPTTKINYQLKSSSQVSLKIYDLLGREIKTIINQFKPAGEYQVDFDGSEFPSGVYIYKLQAGNFTEMKKMMLVK